MFRRELGAALALTLAGCGANGVVIDLNFPSESAFAQSQNARLRIFPRTRDELGTCPTLLDRIATDAFVETKAWDSGAADVCAFRGGLAVPELPAGPHAFVVEVRDSSNRVILVGCTMAETYVGAPDIAVTLSPTSDFAPASIPKTADDRCRSGS
jgi:hypothetical protein